MQIMTVCLIIGKNKNLNPNNSADASLDRDKDGYTNIEEYLNNVVNLKAVSPSEKNNAKAKIH